MKLTLRLYLSFFVLFMCFQAHSTRSVAIMIVELERLAELVQETENDETAAAVVRAFLLSKRLTDQLGVSSILRDRSEAVRSESSCVCCPSCSDEEFAPPFAASCKGVFCPYPGYFTREFVAGVYGNVNGRDVYMCCNNYDHDGFWPLMVCVEPLGYLGNCFYTAFQGLTACLGCAGNACSLSCPLWVRTNRVLARAVTKEEIQASITVLKRQYEAISKTFEAQYGAANAPPYDGKIHGGEAAVVQANV